MPLHSCGRTITWHSFCQHFQCCFLSEAGIPSSLTWFVMSQSSVEMQNHSRYTPHVRVDMATAPALTTPRFCVGCHPVTIGTRFMFLEVLSCACESRTLRAVTSCAWLLKAPGKRRFWFESSSTKSHHCWRRCSVRKRCDGSDPSCTAAPWLWQKSIGSCYILVLALNRPCRYQDLFLVSNAQFCISRRNIFVRLKQLWIKSKQNKT